ncbi:hypothetical protein GGI35DRAFT_441139 [Trichoderma velutinum]
MFYTVAIMGQDPPRRPSQQGFHNTFGQGRSIKRDSIQGDGQRSSGDTAPNPKRIRTVDRPDERSPVDQRDNLEGSSPTTIVSHRQRHPDNPKQHAPSQLSKELASHMSGIKQVLELIYDRMAWCKVRNEAFKANKRAIQSQEQSHYRPSDYASSLDLLATQQKQTLEEMRKAEKHVGEIDDKISSAMQPLLRHISEAWGKSPDTSNASEERVASEAKINTIQTNMKKEMEESFKKEAAESQQFIKELVGSQMAKLKEALAQESEQKLHSLQKTLAKEGEERATALRKTLIQENEKRIAEMKESISREHKAKITALENALSGEAKNKDRIAALEKSLSEEMRNKARIAALEKSLSEEVRNKDRIAELEKSLSEQANYQKRNAELEKTLSEQREKNSGLQKRVARLEVRLDRAEGDQQLLVKSLIAPKQLAVLDDKMLRLEATLTEAVSEQRLFSESMIGKTQLAQQLRQLSLSQDEKFSKFEARVSSQPDYSTKLKELERQLCDHSKFTTEIDQQKDAAIARLGSLESTISNFSKEWEETKKRVEKLSSIRSASVPDSKILEVVKPELGKLDKNTRENIARIQSKLQPFLVQERHKRETLEEQFGDITRQVSKIQEEHATTKADCSGLKEKLNEQNQLNITEGGRLEERLNSRLSLIMDKFRSQMEGVYMQVQTLNTWQTNFNTAGLYRDIISHINKTIPEGPGTAPQIMLLKQQLNSIEARLANWETTSNKRRKLPSGNARVVNGHQIDAQ